MIRPVKPVKEMPKNVPVVMRRGLAIKEQLRILTSKDKKWPMDYSSPENLDSYRVEVGEIIGKR